MYDHVAATLEAAVINWHRILRLLGLILFWCAVGVIAHGQTCLTNSQVTLIGNLRGANGTPSSNSILTLTPSQAGFIQGCGINIATPVTCATSTDGSVVGIPNPLTATIDTSGGGGSLPASTYYTVYEWYDAAGHVTLISPETRISASGTLVVNPPASGMPANAVGMDVFIGTAAGGETLQGQTSGSASFVQSVALISGTAPSSSNTTICQVVANDAVWPTGTGYKASMTDVNGNAVPGFPMQWQLLGPGTTINLANGLPYYHGVVTYPVPILAQPQNHGQQSISGPLNLTGYNLTNVGMLGIGTLTPGWGIDVHGTGTQAQVNSAGYLVNGATPPINDCLGSDGTAFDTNIACVTMAQVNAAILGPNPNTPTIAFNPPADGTLITGPTGSNDAAGIVTLSNGGSGSGAAVFTITFGGTYAHQMVCVISPSGPNFFISSTPNPTSFTVINSGSPATVNVPYLCHQ
jgi:hypothetical protein